MKTRLIMILAVAGAMAATALFFGVGTAAAAITVNCPGDDLQNAIDNAAQFSTITINGTCYGNFTISGVNVNNFGDLTLQGGSPGATLNGKGAGTTLIISGGTVTIRNLTITNGNASEGGGLQLSSTRLAMTNSTVKGNTALFGGGIGAVNASIDLTGVTVTRNTASYQGGGIEIVNVTLTMTASTVSNNRTTQLGATYGGGGIRMQDASVLLTNTKVTTNTSADYGGGIADYGGCLLNGAAPFAPSRCGQGSGKAVGARGLPSIVANGLTLVNSSVDHNIAAFDGGGIYNESVDGDSPVVLQGTTVSFNNAVGGERYGDGGGISNYGVCGNTASLLATKSTFQGNLARNGDGGAIYNSSGDDTCEPGIALTTIAQSPTANGPNVVNANQARRGGGFANEEEDGVASLSLQPGAKVSGNKASVTGGGVWNSCGSFSSLGQIFLNTPNNVVNTCSL